MRCDAGRDCVSAEALTEPRHDFAGYGFYVRYHAACCPGAVDGTTCREDHPPGWTPEHEHDDTEEAT